MRVLLGLLRSFLPTRPAKLLALLRRYESEAAPKGGPRDVNGNGPMTPPSDAALGHVEEGIARAIAVRARLAACKPA